MSRTHPGSLRLNRTTFSNVYEVVRLAEDGRTIIDRWALHPEDAKHLDESLRAKNQLAELKDWTKSCPRHPHWSGLVWNCTFCDRNAKAVERVRELHSRYQAHGADGCDYCREPWPCKTIAALDDPIPTPAPISTPDPAACACVCHTTPGIAHVLPCCDLSGILTERTL